MSQSLLRETESHRRSVEAANRQLQALSERERNKTPPFRTGRHTSPVPGVAHDAAVDAQENGKCEPQQKQPLLQSLPRQRSTSKPAPAIVAVNASSASRAAIPTRCEKIAGTRRARSTSSSSTAAATTSGAHNNNNNPAIRSVSPEPKPFRAAALTAINQNNNNNNTQKRNTSSSKNGAAEPHDLQRPAAAANTRGSISTSAAKRSSSLPRVATLSKSATKPQQHDDVEGGSSGKKKKMENPPWNSAQRIPEIRRMFEMAGPSAISRSVSPLTTSERRVHSNSNSQHHQGQSSSSRSCSAARQLQLSRVPSRRTSVVRNNNNIVPLPLSPRPNMIITAATATKSASAARTGSNNSTQHHHHLLPNIPGGTEIHDFSFDKSGHVCIDAGTQTADGNTVVVAPAMITVRGSAVIPSLPPLHNSTSAVNSSAFVAGPTPPRPRLNASYDNSNSAVNMTASVVSPVSDDEGGSDDASRANINLVMLNSSLQQQQQQQQKSQSPFERRGSSIRTSSSTDSAASRLSSHMRDEVDAALREGLEDEDGLFIVEQRRTDATENESGVEQQQQQQRQQQEDADKFAPESQLPIHLGRPVEPLHGQFVELERRSSGGHAFGEASQRFQIPALVDTQEMFDATSGGLRKPEEPASQSQLLQEQQREQQVENN